jgi:hypothetical protein
MPLFYHMERLYAPHKLRMSLYQYSVYTRIRRSKTAYHT